MDKFSCYTSRIAYFLSQQLQLAWRTAMVVAAVFLFMGSALAQGTATIPSNYCNGTTSDWNNFKSQPKTGFSEGERANYSLDDQFTQGSKDEMLISEWRWAPGNANDKGDITNAGAWLTTGQGSAASSDCILRFFGDRIDASGAANIGFWFFVNPISKNPDGTFSGEHTNGDLLILSNFTKGGTQPVIEAYIWMNGKLTKLNLSGVEWCAGVNSGQQSVPTGLAYTDKDGNTSYQTNTFYEGAINLCQLRAAFPQVSECFSYFMMETRNSPSLSASLQDFAGGNFDVTPAVPFGTPTAETCLVKGTVTVDDPIVGLAYTLSGNGYNHTIVASGSPVVFSNLEDGTYSLTAANGLCVSGGRSIDVDADIQPVGGPGVADQERCGSGPVTFQVPIPLGGVTYRWYDATGETLLHTGTTFTTGTLNSTTTFLVSATGANGCESEFEDIEAIIFIPVVVNAGDDVTSCEASPIQLNGSITGGATTGEWVGGTGTFSPNRQALDAMYTPSAAEVTAGSVTLTLQSVNPVGPCPEESDMITITINDEVSISAGADQTVCSDNPDVTLAGSISGGITTGEWVGGTGIFTPNRQTLNAVYTPSAAEITTGSVTLTLQSDEPEGPCEAASDMMTITINPAATVNAGGPYNVNCVEPRRVQLNGSFGGGATSGTWSGGGGSFSPNANTANAYYIPSAAELLAGTPIELTFTTNDPTGPCDAVRANATVTFDVCRQDIFCTRTQGFYGNEGGKICDGRTTVELLGDLLDEELVLGIYPKTFTVGAGQVNCVIDKLPGGKQASALGGTYTCANVPVSKQGRLTNSLLAQTLVLGLNMRMDEHLYSAPLSASFVTLSTSGCGETAVAIPGTDKTFYISSKVLNKLSSSYTMTVGGLYELANDALGGVYVPSSSSDPSLTEIMNAVDTINNAFDGCRALVTNGLSASTASSLQGIGKAEAGDLRAYPTPFSDKATIEFTTAVDESYSVRLYDMRGALVKELQTGIAKAGVVNQVEVDGKNLPEGLYLARMISDSGARTVKLLLKK